MEEYIKLGLILNLCVNFLLLLAVNCMMQGQSGTLQATAGALVGALYARVCLIPQLSFLAAPGWYLTGLFLTGLTAYCFSPGAMRRGALYCLMRLALDTLADGAVEPKDLLWVGALCIGGIVIFRSDRDRELVRVELNYANRCVRLTALRDTGNTLRDPLTGSAVLVVGADVAKQLTGLTRQQLLAPVQTMGAIPGLRLIPYRTVDRASGFMLAVQVKNARIGGKKGSSVVAMSPQELGGKYQALIGGTG